MAIQGGTPQGEDDLEATAELSLQEITAYSNAAQHDDVHAATDVYPVEVGVGKTTEFESTLRDIESRLQRKSEQVAKLTKELGSTQQQLDTIERELTQQLQAAQAREAQLRTQLQRAEQLLTDTQHQNGVHLGAHQNLAVDLAESRRRAERQWEALASLQGYRNLSDTLLAAQEEQLLVERSAAAAKIHALEQLVQSAQLLAAGQSASDTGQLRGFEADIKAAASLYEDTQDSLKPIESSVVAPQQAERRKTKHALVRNSGASAISYSVGRRTTIGRTPENDIQIDVAVISRNHAVLTSDGDLCVVEDLNSTNGIKVNGRRVDRHTLHDGDVLTVGTTNLTYQFRT